jgi:hypothetical protein
MCLTMCDDFVQSSMFTFDSRISSNVKDQLGLMQYTDSLEAVERVNSN